MRNKKSKASKEFKERIKIYCEEQKLPLYALAYRLGRSQAALSYILNDIRNFSRDNKFLKELAEMIGYSGPLLECDESEKRQAVG